MSDLMEMVGLNFEKQGFSVNRVYNNGSNCLRCAFIPISGDDGTVISDIRPMNFHSDEEYDYFYVFTYVLGNIKERDFEYLLVTLNNFNLKTIYGYYGLDMNKRIIFHKHVTKIRKDIPEKELVSLYTELASVIALVSDDYKQILDMITK